MEMYIHTYICSTKFNTLNSNNIYRDMISLKTMYTLCVHMKKVVRKVIFDAKTNSKKSGCPSCTNSYYSSKNPLKTLNQKL